MLSRREETAKCSQGAQAPQPPPAVTRPPCGRGQGDSGWARGTHSHTSQLAPLLCPSTHGQQTEQEAQRQEVTAGDHTAGGPWVKEGVEAFLRSHHQAAKQGVPTPPDL